MKRKILAFLLVIAYTQITRWGKVGKLGAEVSRETCFFPKRGERGRPVWLV